MLQHALAVGLANWLETYVAENVRTRGWCVATLRQPRRVVFHDQPPAWPYTAMAGDAQAPLAMPEAEGRGGRKGLSLFIGASACLHGSSCTAQKAGFDYTRLSRGACRRSPLSTRSASCCLSVGVACSSPLSTMPLTTWTPSVTLKRPVFSTRSQCWGCSQSIWNR